MLLREELAKGSGHCRGIIGELAPGEPDDLVAEELQGGVALSVGFERGAAPV
jgi:hypothetical protein